MSKHLETRRPKLQQKIDEAISNKAKAEHIHTLVTLYEERGRESGMGAIAALIDDAHGPQDQRSRETRAQQTGIREDKLLIEKQVLRELLKNPHNTNTPESQNALGWIRDDSTLPHLQEELKRHEEKATAARKRKGHAHSKVQHLEANRPDAPKCTSSHAQDSHRARLEEHEKELAAARLEAEHHGHDEHGMHSGHHPH